jgi:hypothetical protein
VRSRTGGSHVIRVNSVAVDRSATGPEPAERNC